MTRSQIDKLGERLLAGRRDEELLRKVEEFYNSYEPAARSAGVAVRTVLARRRGDVVLHAERSTKTLDSIVAKLKRERTRLSTMQDIVGCRIIVPDLQSQESLKRALVMKSDTRTLETLWWEGLPAFDAPPFSKFVVTDRSEAPKSGYRALHIVVRDFEVPYEIQIRTRMQDRWAQISERLNDWFQGFKYGGGPPQIRERLEALSERTYQAEVAYYEISERIIAQEQRDDVTEDSNPDFEALYQEKADLEEGLAGIATLYDGFEASMGKELP